MEYEPYTTYARKDLYSDRSGRVEDDDESEAPGAQLGHYFRPVHLAPLPYGRQENAESAEKVDTGSLADRVFGQQLRHGSATTESLRASLDKRSELFKHMMHDLYDRRNELTNRLHLARRPYSIRAPQEMARLDKMLLDMESEIRSEELAFWKDTAEVQANLLEAYFEHAAVKQRASLFDGPEEEHG